MFNLECNVIRFNLILDQIHGLMQYNNELSIMTKEKKDDRNELMIIKKEEKTFDFNDQYTDLTIV